MYPEFIERYHLLIRAAAAASESSGHHPPTDKSDRAPEQPTDVGSLSTVGEMRHAIQRILDAVVVDPATYSIGRSMVFLKGDAMSLIESKRRQVMAAQELKRPLIAKSSRRQDRGRDCNPVLSRRLSSRTEPMPPRSSRHLKTASQPFLTNTSNIWKTRHCVTNSRSWRSSRGGKIA